MMIDSTALGKFQKAPRKHNASIYVHSQAATMNKHVFA